MPNNDKVRTTLYKVRWEGYDKKDDTWEPITQLQGYATMVKTFKESDAKDVEKLAADRLREADKKVKDNATITPKRTVLSMVDPYLCSVNSWHVPDGVWGILPMHPTHQTDESL
jgi:hypothetical protein